MNPQQYPNAYANMFQRPVGDLRGGQPAPPIQVGPYGGRMPFQPVGPGQPPGVQPMPQPQPVQPIGPAQPIQGMPQQVVPQRTFLPPTGSNYLSNMMRPRMMINV